jgi:hypothetical protein
LRTTNLCAIFRCVLRGDKCGTAHARISLTGTSATSSRIAVILLRPQANLAAPLRRQHHSPPVTTIHHHQQPRPARACFRQAGSRPCLPPGPARLAAVRSTPGRPACRYHCSTRAPREPAPEPDHLAPPEPPIVRPARPTPPCSLRLHSPTNASARSQPFAAPRGAANHHHAATCRTTARHQLACTNPPP